MGFLLFECVKCVHIQQLFIKGEIPRARLQLDRITIKVQRVISVEMKAEGNDLIHQHHLEECALLGKQKHRRVTHQTSCWTFTK